MESFVSILVLVLLFWAALALSDTLWSYLLSPLKVFPGPVAARYTNFWRFRDVVRGNCQNTHIKLHRKHGTAVRMGPNIISLSDPNLINTVFSTKTLWKKSAMYGVKEPIVDGRSVPNLFSTRDENWHSFYMRPIAPLYSMTKLLELEHCIDEMILCFTKKLTERFAETLNVCNMDQYLLYFSWDLMNKITFGEDLGILDAGKDVTGFLEISAQDSDYFARTSQIPRLHRLLSQNRFLRFGPPAMDWAVVLGTTALQKRQANGPPEKPDFLEKLLGVRSKYSDIIDDNMMITYLLNNLIAGSDTTANLLCATIYYVLKNPNVHEKLSMECASLETPVSWKKAQQLPYLDAVMREAMRIHPGAALMLERVVPEGGLTLPDGRYIPEGTIVGMNPWVVNRDEAVFGPEPDRFIPERWMKQIHETEAEFQTRRSKMKSCELSFGAGKRACLGKRLSQLESYKLIATLFSTFEMGLTFPSEEWKVTNSWFVRNENIRVTLKSRSQ
ncbi:hypothetical protein DTO027B5_2442 [Paecilomyces variotii]|nr:hypothetical protein DTO169C6_2614 [Paecilomyces variotii]KAJ9288104.1 hypothetical protein DTO021C3_4277 [Paecilomyces variotii]KAJ9329030.1 hypothetical protein DTO027B3_430 [Paecilomyces variotii]KAJ9335849.1 hypothetical protein DTO027B5_2442 [Paecilomyces variotii]